MDFSALRKFPWNEEIYLAQQGDTQAVRRTCATAEPIVDQFGNHKRDCSPLRLLAPLCTEDKAQSPAPPARFTGLPCELRDHHLSAFDIPVPM